MQDLALWLEELGMSGYARRFAENGITAAALRHLTDQDLKDIGVLLGYRLIMLRRRPGPRPTAEPGLKVRVRFDLARV